MTKSKTTRRTMTITLRKEDRAQLRRLGDELNLTAREVAERILHRNLNKGPARTSPSNRERATARALRQLELTRLLRRRRLSTLGQADKQELAQRFGVTERTIYRDMLVVEQALKRAPLDDDEAMDVAVELADEPSMDEADMDEADEPARVAAAS